MSDKILYKMQWIPIIGWIIAMILSIRKIRNLWDDNYWKLYGYHLSWGLIILLIRYMT